MQVKGSRSDALTSWGCTPIRTDSPRWVEVTPSQFAHERAGLTAVRELLPDADPYRAWANLEFVGDDGSTNEVDLIVLARNGLHVIELKHWTGSITGDGTTWIKNGRPVDNPLLLTTRKAKRLRSLLERVAREKKSKTKVPYVKASVLLHASDVTVKLDAAGRNGIYRLDTDNNALDRISEDLLTAPLRDLRDGVDGPRGREIAKLLDQAGIRRSVRSRTVGSVVVAEDVLAEGPGWQDYVGEHSALEGVVRRVRFYLVDRAASAEQKSTVKRAAGREFAILEGISHPGVARAIDFVEHERGPAVIFERDPDEKRLDHFLAEHPTDLGIDDQLQLVRALAETIQYAHGRRLVHRALSPTAVTVRRTAADSWAVRVQDWQTGGRGAGSQSGTAFVAGTRHLDALIDPTAAPYIAPEAYTSPDPTGVALDVFSLGAIAFHIFTGAPPAVGADDLQARLIASGGGLDVTSLLDGAPPEMRDLVYEATYGDVDLRTQTAADFVTALNKLEEQLTAPDAEPSVDPLDAQQGDLLADSRFLVMQRLGVGSTARALLVQDTSKPEGAASVVLKIALDESKADRLRDEAEVLGEIRERRVVALIEGPLTVNNRTALLLEDAGRESLATLIRNEGRLSIDLLERWGRDLLEVTQAMDEVGVNHRDIKPDNLAFGVVGSKHKRVHLRLFDFSLSRAPLDQTKAGTPPYLDPFFDPVKRPRWDAAAERYAVAVTLFEMATGSVPVYGSGESHPAMVTDEASIEAELFEPAIADALARFFRRALRRDHKSRFDTVADMAAEWSAVFSAIPQAASVATVEPVLGDDRDALAAAATVDTPLTHSGLTVRAVSALGRHEVSTVGELLGLGGETLIRGVPDATRKEIRRRVKQWRIKLVSVIAPNGGIEVDAQDAAAEDTRSRSVDAILARLIPKPTARSGNESRAAQLLLGMADTEGEPLTWPTQGEVATRLGVSGPRVAQIAAKVRARWAKDSSLAEVGDEVTVLLADAGGVMSATELARALLIARGSIADEPLRTTQAIGLVRAAAEVELERGGDARLDVRRTPAGVLLAAEPTDPSGSLASELFDYALALGRVASELADDDPLPSAQQCVQRLRAIAEPDGFDALDDARLPRLAAAASAKTAVNGRGEIYPVGMSADRALPVLSSALAGGGTAQQLEERLRSRFPLAAPLPARPALTDLLRAAGLQLSWNGQRYVPPTQGESSAFASRTRTRTRVVDADALPAEFADIESRLVTSLETAAFLTLTVDSRRLQETVTALVARFGVTPYDVTRELLAHMRAAARSGNVVWDVVLRADRADAPPGDGARLRQLVGQAAKPVEAALAELPARLLIIEAAPLARYDRLAKLEQLADRPTRRPAARWLLVPVDGGGTPKLDGRPAPISSGWLRLPNEWIAHTNKAAGRAS